MRARLFPLALALTACRPAAVPLPSAAPALDPCVVARVDASPADSAIVATAGAVDAKGLALDPHTPADSVAFAQIYETLVRVTCDGRIVPGLAERWKGADSGRTWTIVIRADATFADGTPVTGRDVADAWRERRYARSPQRDPRVISLEAISFEAEREITVHLRDPHPEGPRPLADPYFAIHRAAMEPGSRAGTGLYLAPSPADTSNRVGLPAPVTRIVPRNMAHAPILVLRAPGAGDGRDLIDQGLDLLVTSDRRLIDYAATRPELQAKRLPPDRVYVLLSTARSAQRIATVARNEDPRWDPLRVALARDVTRTNSPTMADPWWATSSAIAVCSDDAPSPAPAWDLRVTAGRATRLVYPMEDRLAGELARRLVALATFEPGASEESSALRELFPEFIRSAGGAPVAVGLNDGELARSLFNGADLGYLIPLPRRALDHCAAWRGVRLRAPWVSPGTPVVLAETGPTLIMSARAPAVMVDWDNTLRIVGAHARTVPQ